MVPTAEFTLKGGRFPAASPLDGTRYPDDGPSRRFHATKEEGNGKSPLSRRRVGRQRTLPLCPDKKPVVGKLFRLLRFGVRLYANLHENEYSTFSNVIHALWLFMQAQPRSKIISSMVLDTPVFLFD